MKTNTLIHPKNSNWISDDISLFLATCISEVMIKRHKPQVCAWLWKDSNLPSFSVVMKFQTSVIVHLAGINNIIHRIIQQTCNEKCDLNDFFHFEGEIICLLLIFFSFFYYSDPKRLLQNKVHKGLQQSLSSQQERLEHQLCPECYH